MPVVVSSSALPIDVTPLLSAIPGVEVRVPARGAMSPDELRQAVREADGLICLLSDQIDAALLAAAPRLRVIANFAVGFDNVDLAAATRGGVVVCNTPDVLTEATADFAFALLLAAARRVCEGDRLVRRGAWTGWAPTQLLGASVHGRTLGIVGLGRIGRAVARRARGFDMSVLYAGRRPVPDADADGARHVPLATLLAGADFVSLHCPLTDETRQLIDAAALATMKPGAILVNTARGGCVDEAALAAALSSGALAGAGLDVFAEEPAVHPALRACERVVLAPHAGSATVAARTRMAELCAGAIAAVLTGERPETVVNTGVYR